MSNYLQNCQQYKNPLIADLIKESKTFIGKKEWELIDKPGNPVVATIMGNIKAKQFDPP